MQSKADVILHPVRLRILQRLVGGTMTAQELAEALPDVPHATLYRHLNRLARADIISVVSEIRVRGATERTYAVKLERAAVSPEDLSKLGPDDHMRLFMAFIASVIDGFQRYLDQSQVDLLRDGVSYTQATLHLSDDELRQLREESAAMTMRFLQLRPGPGRRARILSSIMVPEPLTANRSKDEGDAK